MVSTYAYVNPVIAVLLGWLFANESISVRQVLALAVILVVGVGQYTQYRNVQKPATAKK
ncbi:EamA family transporter [Larkinella sp.]|uniref:EamA family transporter n=1 Tax=Larkinella sp. TaxID=2034517 RepID=UPI003BAD8F1F